VEKRYRFIHITDISSKPKANVYGVFNNANSYCLGTIEWYVPWRQYCFIPLSGTVFSAGCLADIMDFIKNEAGKEQKDERA
jgi:hypothetical protein